MAPPLLAALAAAFIPDRAAACLARLPDPAPARAAAELSPRPRSERLTALSEALAASPRPSPAARESAAAVERPRLAALLRGGAEATSARPLLRRLLLELGWGAPT